MCQIRDLPARIDVRMRKHGKVDHNHREIADALRRLGYQVLSLANCGQGVPDLLIGKYQHLTLVEVKTEKGKLTPQQDEFRKRWPVIVLRSAHDAATFAFTGVQPALVTPPTARPAARAPARPRARHTTRPVSAARNKTSAPEA